MSLSGIISDHATHATDYYKSKNHGRLEKAFLARASFLDATIASTIELTGRIVHLAYEFFRGLTVGVLFFREAPRTRFFNATTEVAEHVGQIAVGLVGILCPHLVVKTRNWVNKVPNSAVQV